MTVVIAQPKPAADVIPRIVGSAKGLRVMPCKRTPATARHAPAIAAFKNRGKRISHTIVRANGFSEDVNPETTSERLRLNDPKINESNKIPAKMIIPLSAKNTLTSRKNPTNIGIILS